MIKAIIREILMNSLLLYIIPYAFPGLHITGDYQSYALGGVALTIGFLILRPLLKIVTLPFNLLTLGIFSSFINIIVLYIVTLYYPKISITAFTFPGFAYKNFAIPSFYVPLLLSYALISATIYLIKKIAYLLIF